MSELLSRDEYAAIASGMQFPVNPFINGAFHKPRSGKRMDSINPATGELLARVAACGAADVDEAVQKGREAFDAGHWSRCSPSERKDVLVRLARLIRRHRHELAVLESLESGKPILECAMTDLPETVEILKWHGEAADKSYDQLAPASDDAVGMIVREPVGVVGCVLPWNFPLMMLAWKIGPALATGNSVVVKPAEQTCMTALRVAELAMEAGLPAGVLNVVPGLGPEAGEPLGRHMDVGALSFTGSTEVGRLYLTYSAQSNLKKIVLECGGKSPSVVLSDAEHLDSVARHVVYAAMWNMGQNCTANSRLIVHEAVRDALMERIMQQLRNWKTGDPLDPTNQLGAIVSREQFGRVNGFIESGIQQGAELVQGERPASKKSKDAGKEDSGLFIPPVVFDKVTPDMRIAQEEIFGPVLAVLSVASDAAAIELANDSCYGLQASLFTGNVTRALRYARALQAGTVSVNCYSEGNISTPFGGFKQSGFGGRDNSLLAHDQYTEVKTIWIDISDTAMEDTI